MVFHERLRVCHLEQREGGAFEVQWSRAYRGATAGADGAETTSVVVLIR